MTDLITDDQTNMPKSLPNSILSHEGSLRSSNGVSDLAFLKDPRHGTGIAVEVAGLCLCKSFQHLGPHGLV